MNQFNGCMTPGFHTGAINDGASPYTKIQGVEKILSKKCFSMPWEVSILGTFPGTQVEDFT